MNLRKKIFEWFNHPNFWFVFVLYWIFAITHATVTKEGGWYITALLVNMLVGLYNLILRDPTWTRKTGSLWA